MIVPRLSLALLVLALVACGGPDVAITPRVALSVTPTEEPALTRTPRPPPTPSRTPAPTAYFVANTGGDGAVLRASPARGERVASLAEGARVVPQGEEQQVDGRSWLRVQEPGGTIGWIAQELLAATPVATGTPRGTVRTPTPRR